jgi:ABC-type antimicrobial peptide transport system permease subunit
LFVRLLLAFASVHQTTCYKYSQGQLKKELEIVLQPTLYLVKQAWGSLKKKPGFVATVVTTMGTTLGALVCVLTLVYLLIWEPLPYPQQDKLYNVSYLLNDKMNQLEADSFTYPGLIHLYRNQDVFEKTALIGYGQDVLTSLPHQPTFNTAYVTPEWFGLLGASMQLGRMFEATEALDTFNPVAILSYRTWQDDFAGNTDVLAEKVTFRGISFRIIGVLGNDFVEPQIKKIGLQTGIWLPWDYNLDVQLKHNWGNLSPDLTFVGRLKETPTAYQAEQVITSLVNDTWIENIASIPFFNDWSIEMKLESFQTAIVGDSQNTVYQLLAGVFGLVFIAFANIANLFMSRTAEQQRQLAIYAALGAKKSHLFRGLLGDSGLLMSFSVLVAMVIASLGFSLLQANLASELPRINELGVNYITFLASIILGLLFAFSFAFFGTKMINYRALNFILQTSGKGKGKGTGVQVSKRFRQGLIVSQVAIATVLVFANVVKSVKMPAQSDVPMRVYTPSSLASPNMTLKLRDGQSVRREQVVTAINNVSNLYALFNLETLDSQKRSRLFTQYTTATTTSALAIITLFLASVGLYGILSYGTQMRRFELGTRMAIGAKRKDLVGLIVKDNLWVIVLGIASSIVVMLGIYIGYTEVLLAYMSVDLLPIFLTTILSIALLSLFACYWPLRRYINHPAIHSLRGSD